MHVEKENAVMDLPHRNRRALGEKHPEGAHTTVEELVNVPDGQATLDVYEVLLLSADKKTFELKIIPAVKITETGGEGGQETTAARRGRNKGFT